MVAQPLKTHRQAPTGWRSTRAASRTCEPTVAFVRERVLIATARRAR